MSLNTIHYMPDIVFEIYNTTSQFSKVKEIWTHLLKKCPHTYYLSWAWTETWIKSIPPDCNLKFVVGIKKESPVVAFFLGSKTSTRRKFFKFRQVALNQTLIPDIDRIWVEYNAILIDPEVTINLQSLLDLIPIKSWDEFSMERCSSIYQPNLIFNNDLKMTYLLKNEKFKSYFVDLDKVRRNNYDYLAIISPKKRYQIRRSIKEYEKMGKIELQCAEDRSEALKILDELTELHQKRWTTRGLDGAMSSRYVSNFHKNLVSSRFHHGEIQLMKISAGPQVIGCLYSFVYRGEVSGYMCGFNYLDRYVYSPGFVCHYYAIMHNAMKGYNCYDFLEGEHAYKKSLSTDFNEMETILIIKKGLNYTLERNIANLFQLYKKIILGLYTPWFNRQLLASTISSLKLIVADLPKRAVSRFIRLYKT